MERSEIYHTAIINDAGCPYCHCDGILIGQNGADIVFECLECRRLYFLLGDDDEDVPPAVQH